MKKKLNDEEIIAALENCNSGFDDMNRHSCATCPYREIEPCGKAQMTDCIDLIRRQKAENERLLNCVEKNFTFETTKGNKYSVFNTVRKEFAEKLKEVIHERDYIQGYAEIGLIEEIDELLKEYEK